MRTCTKMHEKVLKYANMCRENGRTLFENLRESMEICKNVPNMTRRRAEAVPKLYTNVQTYVEHVRKYVENLRKSAET